MKERQTHASGIMESEERNLRMGDMNNLRVTYGQTIRPPSPAIPTAVRALPSRRTRCPVIVLLSPWIPRASLSAMLGEIAVEPSFKPVDLLRETEVLLEQREGTILRLEVAHASVRVLR